MNCNDCPKASICPVPRAEEFLAAHPDEEEEHLEGMKVVCDELFKLMVGSPPGPNHYAWVCSNLMAAMRIGYAMGRMYEPIPKVWKNI